MPRNRVVAGLLLALVLVLGALAVFWPRQPELVPLDPATQPAGPARRVAELLLRDAATRDLAPRPEGRAYVALRRGGERVAERWAEAPDWRQALLRAVAEATAGLPADREPDTVEACLPYARRGARLRAKRAMLGNVHRGVRGVVLRLDGREEWTCSSEMIATNRDFDKLEERFQQAAGLTREQLVERAEAEQFDTHQLLITLGNGGEAADPDAGTTASRGDGRIERMLRGNALVPMSAVDRAGVEALAQGMGDWMTRQVHADGRMTYMYWPSRGEEATHLNNMIRQFMASLALVRLAGYRDDPAIEALARRNLAYNFRHFYREVDGLGLITYRNKSKLGAAALAALGIVEAPFRAELAHFEQALVRTTKHMQQPDGSFHTFYGTNRNDNQNFYPGETLLLWASLLERERDEALLERFMRAFRYYRDWHRNNRNPAFIPWHTQAYYKVWRLTRDQALADFIFEMNDFIAGFQEWDDARYPDTRGRFYDDDRRQFGPPHASSTGVYLEGLIDAYALAVEQGDAERVERYRTAILRGMRSLMQLQFQDAVDMFYISKRDRVLGALRTTVYDNRIRVDNVQHSLMGLMKIIPAFTRDGAWGRDSPSQPVY